MTPEGLEAAGNALKTITEGDKPFMALFAIIMLFVIFMSIKVMTYVKSVSDSHSEQISGMNENMKEQREDHYKMVAEERVRSDKREEILFLNMDKNTEQIGTIATTLKEVQFNFTSLENKVTENFDYLLSEIDNVKTQVTVKTAVVQKEEDHD